MPQSKNVPIYFDVTDIVQFATNRKTVTGIQRSALRIIESFMREGDGRPVYGLVNHPLSGEFSVADLSFMREQYKTDDFASRFGLHSGKRRWFAQKLRRYNSRSSRRRLRSYELALRWALSRGLRRKFEANACEAKPSCLTAQAIEPGAIIVSLGAGWGTDYAAVRELAHANNCKTISFIYDILPITAAHILSHKYLGSFRKWVDYAAKNSALLICCSEFTKKQLGEYLSAHNLACKIAVAKFPHEFALSSDSGQPALRSDVASLAREPFILYVGTFEIRKNLFGLLKAWSELQKERPAGLPSLVLAGKKGWKIDDLYAFLRDTNNVNGTVKIVDGPSDAELELLYRNCKFTVFPSLLEGWGLPIGESLWFGKPVLCANNSSMPEVGGRFATYFSHDDPGSLQAKLEEMLDNPPELPTNIRDYLTTWKDTARSIRDILDREAAREAAPKDSAARELANAHY